MTKVIEVFECHRVLERQARRVGAVSECSICFSDIMEARSYTVYGLPDSVSRSAARELQPTGCAHRYCESCAKRVVMIGNGRCCAPPGNCPGTLAGRRDDTRSFRPKRQRVRGATTLLDCPFCLERDCVPAETDQLETMGARVQVECRACRSRFCANCRSPYLIHDCDPGTRLSRHYTADPSYSDRVLPETKAAELSKWNFADPTLPVPCPTCGLLLRKTTECNILTHCAGSRVCYLCGAKSHEWERYGVGNDHPCPKYDHDPRILALGYRCVQGLCHSDSADCADPSHAAGIEALHRFRRRAIRAGLGLGELD